VARRKRVGGENTSLTAANPVSGTDRLLNLDVLRGLSLFGILLVNMAFYSLPMFYYPPGLPQWQRPIDRHLDTLILYSGETEFLTLFSFLFGLGFAIQLSRAGSGRQANLLFFRRIAVLLGFGLFHAFVIWMGDVLVWYAIVAVALFLFRSARPRTLISAAVLVFVLRIARLEWLMLYSGALSSGPISKVSNVARLDLVQQCLSVYARGSFWEIFVQRARDVWFQYSHPVDFLLHILMVFLVGLYAGKQRIFQRTGESRRLFVSVWYFGVVFGIGGHLLRYSLPHIDAQASVMLAPLLTVISDLALAAFYLTSVILAMNHPGVAKLSTPLASIGRMTLTNYLCQSLICTTLTYSYGFGLYGKLRPLDWLGLTLAIYFVQVSLSVLWLRRFAYGPAEWLWRSLVYGKRIRMRLLDNASLPG
jgi:uncharacterized protein